MIRLATKHMTSRMTVRMTGMLTVIALAFLAMPPSFTAIAEEGKPETYIPHVLQAWVPWVKESNPDLFCSLQNSTRLCDWPGYMELNIAENSGSFELHLTLDKAMEVPLPGGNGPGGNGPWVTNLQRSASKDVSTTETHTNTPNNTSLASSTNRELTVLNREELPYVFLPAGDHTLSGSFQWNNPPDFILIPQTYGVITLNTKNSGPRLVYPDSNNRLWVKSPDISDTTGPNTTGPNTTGPGDIKRPDDESRRESVNITAFRMLKDGIPMSVTTHLELSISGKPRPIPLGDILTPNFTPVKLTSQLGYKFLPGNQLIIEGRPGKFTLELLSLESETIEKAKMDKIAVIENPTEGWPEFEYWAWTPDEALRSVELSGATQIDTSYVALPSNWTFNKLYKVKVNSDISIKETRRGEETLPQDSLALQRQFWLDEDGKGLTIRDVISGKLYTHWRLNMQSHTALGRVEVEAQNRLITSDPLTHERGVEIRNQNVQLIADSRMPYNNSPIPAVGWSETVSSLSISLRLPPGWDLWGASGVRNVSHSWIQSWDLLKIFTVILLAFMTSRLFGSIWGIVMALALVAQHQTFGAPLALWFIIYAFLALDTFVTYPPVKKVAQSANILLKFYLIITCLYYVLGQLQLCLFPQLTYPILPGGGLSVFVWLLGAFVGLYLLSTLIDCLANKLYRRAFFFCLIVCPACLIIIIVLIQSFAYSRYDSSYHDSNAYSNTSPETQDVMARNNMSMGSSGRSLVSNEMSAPSKARSYYSNAKDDIDPHAQVQTGPGVPERSGKVFTLNWAGAVQKHQNIKLYLQTPGQQMLLSLLRIILMLLLTYKILLPGKILRPGTVEPDDKDRPDEKKTSELAGTATALAVLVFSSIFLFTADISAENNQVSTYPSPELLEQLTERISRNTCNTNCTAASTIELNVLVDSASSDINSLSQVPLVIKATVHSRGNAAWAIPGPVSEYAPQSITLDGKRFTAVRRDATGILWARIPDGTHQLVASGSIPNRTTTSLRFESPSGVITLRGNGWQAEGVEAQGLATRVMQIIRTSSSSQTSENALSPAEQLESENSGILFEPWYYVERQLLLGSVWSVQTTVKRFGQLNQATEIKFPLLSGESVVTPGLDVSGSLVSLPFGYGVEMVTFTSALNIQNQLTQDQLTQDQLILQAVSNKRVSEEWFLSCSPIWHCRPSGIAPTSSYAPDHERQTWQWQPWAGEKVAISVIKPEGVSGQTVTIEKATLAFSPSDELLQTSISLTITASQGAWHTMALPQGSSVSSLMINGSSANIQYAGSKLTVPLSPGRNTILLEIQATEIDNWLRTFPQFDLGAPLVNLSQTIRVPHDKWLLWVKGPAWGPVIIMWGKLLAIALMCLLVRFLLDTPLTLFHWVALSLGLFALPTAYILIPLFWFLAMAKASTLRNLSTTLYRMVHLGLMALTVCFLSTLYIGVYTGLILDPSSLVLGDPHLLSWYKPRSGSLTPELHWLAIDVWVWRVFMLIWSLWLASSVLRWMKWGNECYTTFKLKGKSE